jgi:hypothetical protein
VGSYSKNVTQDIKKQIAFNDSITYESEMSPRFRIDIDEKPHLDDERARKKIIGEFQAKRLNEEMQKDSSFFLVVEKTPLELADDIRGRWSFITRPIQKIRIHVRNFANTIITSKIFEALTIVVIILNSIALAADDPT